MSMKNSNDTVGSRTRDIPTCSAVPEPTALPRTPTQWIPGVFFPGIKRLGYDVDHSTPSGAVVKNKWNCSSVMHSWREYGQLYLLLAVSKNASHILKLIEYLWKSIPTNFLFYLSFVM